jgi:hypothetical protein
MSRALRFTARQARPAATMDLAPRTGNQSSLEFRRVPWHDLMSIEGIRRPCRRQATGREKEARMVNWDRPQPAPLALFRFIHANFPVVRNSGIYNHRTVAGTNVLSHLAEGRAIDLGLLVGRPNEKLLGDRLFRIFIDNAAELEVDELIWNHVIWSKQKQFEHSYRGVDPHTNHIHVGYTRDGSQKTAIPSKMMISVAILRTGLEDLARQAPGYGFA